MKKIVLLMVTLVFLLSSCAAVQRCRPYSNPGQIGPLSSHNQIQLVVLRDKQGGIRGICYVQK